MKRLFTYKTLLLLLAAVLLYEKAEAQYTEPTGEIVDYTVKSTNFEEQFSYYTQPSVNFDSSPYDDFSYIKRDVSKFMNFRLLFPNDFETSSPNKVYPIIVMIHGKGEGALGWHTLYPNDDPRKFNNNHQLLWGGENHLDAVRSGEFPGLILFPQSDFGAWDNHLSNPNDFSDLLLELVEKLSRSAEFKIDPLRIYIWGLSNGGAGTITAIQRRPDLFAAAQPMCGWQNDPNHTPPNVYERMAHKPIRYFHGEKDPLQYGYMSGELKNIGEAGGAGRQEFILDPNSDHGVWHDAIKRKDFFSWFLKYNQLSILAFHGKNQICPDEIESDNKTLKITVKLGIAPGHKDYQWSYNGTETNNIIFEGENRHNIIVNKLGNYYVRIKTQGSNEWSSWSEPLEIKPADPIPGPKVTASGSTFFPTLDDATEVVLSAFGYDKYQWSNNHNTPTNTYPSNYGPGFRTLRVKELYGCFTEWSDTIYVSTGNTPLNMTPPSSITLSPISESRINIFWEDTNSDENGYEIYRSDDGGTSYKFLTQTEKNIEYYTDKGLEPQTTYQYQIRAVKMKMRGNTILDRGMSSPTTSSPSTTLADEEAPSRPSNLVAKTNLNINGVSLTWEPSFDNIGVVGYNVYQVDNDNNFKQVGTTDTTHYEINGLVPNTSYIYVVKAKDKGGNLSEESNQAFVVTALCGLQYTFYVTNAANPYASVNNFLPSQITGIGTVNNFDIGIRYAHGENINDHFGFEFEGEIEIHQSGTYTFELGSDDGSVLWIDNIELINHDNAHSHTTKKKDKFLEAGLHPIKVRYFEIGGEESLELKYSGPGIPNLTPVPDEVLCNYPEISPNVPTNLLASNEALTSIKLSWEHNNNNAYGFELYRGRSEDSNFELVATTVLNTKEFTDTGLEPYTIYYYKVKAIGPNGQSAYSSVIHTSTLKDTDAPDEIDDLEEVSHADYTALLRWTAPEDNVGVTGYNIYQMKENNELILLAQTDKLGDPHLEYFASTSNNVTLLSNPEGQSIYYQLKGLTPGTSYNVVVTAFDASDNESELSNIVSFKTSGESPLPIELIAFSGKVIGKTVRLKWKTSSEKDNDYFTIERAINSKNFQVLGTVNGAGTSIKEMSYSFIDNYPSNGTLFYRLKQTDYNGDYEYSNIISVTYPSVGVNDTELANITLYPNPTSSENINLKIEDANVKGTAYLKIIDLLGKTYLDYQIDAGSLSKGKGLQIQTGHKLTPGIYIVLIEHENKVNKIKLVINE